MRALTVGKKYFGYFRCRCRKVIRRRMDSKTKTCGCTKKKRMGLLGAKYGKENGLKSVALRIKHGACETREYSSWTHMKQRCFNKKQIGELVNPGGIMKVSEIKQAQRAIFDESRFKTPQEIELTMRGIFDAFWRMRGVAIEMAESATGGLGGEAKSVDKSFEG